MVHTNTDQTSEGWADTNVFEPWAGYAVESPTDSGKITFLSYSRYYDCRKNR